MKQILCLFIGLAVFAMSGCGRIENDRLREVKKLMGRKIVFDSSLEPIACNMAEAQNPLDAKVKIVAYIDEMACTNCALKILIDWQESMVDMDKRVEFVPVIYPVDKAKLQDFLCANDVKYELMYDAENKFKKQNRLDVSYLNRTFLLDSNNRIVLVGEPIGNPTLWKLYVDTANKLIAEGSDN